MERQRIIFVDDEPDFLAGIRRLFHSYKNMWDLKLTAKPSEVIEWLAIPQDTVVVSDLNMPDMDGLSLCHQSRAVCKKHDTADLYFILLSRQADAEARTIGLEGGADDYVAKPFEFEELLARIKIGMRMLEQRTLLREAKRQAEAASAAKSNALANMSHEIRTPMNAILGLSAILQESPIGKEEATLARTIYSAAEGLLHIVNDVLDISKIEAGKFELDAYDFDICSLFEQVAKITQVAAQERGTTVTTDISGQIPTMVNGDGKRLRQVLINLLGNAAKFTKDGTICIKAHLINHTDQYDRLSIQVVDTGIGIPEEKQNRLFEAFSQADRRIATRYGGTGLGLALSQQIVRLFGGEIKVDSKVGRGTTFSFEIVLGKSRSTAKAAKSANVFEPIVNSEKWRLVLADDNAVNRKVEALMLGKMGLCATEFANGQQVINYLKKEPVDLVLLDVEMPVMNGLEVVKALKTGKACSQNPNVKIVAVTGHAMKGNMEKLINAGMDGVLTKPIRPELLRQELICQLQQTV